MSLQDQTKEAVHALRNLDRAALDVIREAASTYELLLARTQAEHAVVAAMGQKERYAWYGAITTSGLEAVDMLAKRARAASSPEDHDTLRSLGLRLQATTSAFIKLAMTKAREEQLRS